ncbi:MAG: hypothetical protein KJS70_02340 [Actinomycetales bacterium]|nr:hypothetical protein [Actinomycetales bacterium]
MKTRSKVSKATFTILLTLAVISPAQAADTPSTLITLTPPADLAGVPSLPFTGVTAAPFTLPEPSANLAVTPQQGFIGDSFEVSGKGLAASTELTLVWGTGNATWVADVLPNSVNYMGVKFTKVNIVMTKVTTDASGAFTYKTKVPIDFGGIHDIYAVANGVSLAHGGYQVSPKVSVSPTSGPIGTPITVTYTGLGANLYTAGGSVLWDNHYAGEMQGLWTRGTANAVIRAAGAIGNHVLQAQTGIGITYLNIIQSPVPYSKGGSAIFRITKDAGAPAAYIKYPKKVTPTVSLRTTLTDLGLDPASKAVATLSKNEGIVGSKTTINVKGMVSTGVHTLSWSTVVGSRVNCPTSTCWIYNGIPLGTVDVTSADFSKEVEIPDNLGGWHVIQVKKGDVVEAQVPFYVQASIFNYTDKDGRILSAGIAKADPNPIPEARNGSGIPTNKFKVGEEFTIAMKGVGWTQLDNTMAVTYDNSYIGYGCGFNSNGYMVIHLKATGAPGTHIIDLHPLMYTNQPSFPGTPYGMLPILTADRDFPGLALGYQLPSVHFAITVTK